MRRKYLLRSAPSGALAAMTMRAGRTETAFASASRMNASDNAAAAAGVIDPISLVLTRCSMGSRQNTISAGRDCLNSSLYRVRTNDVYRHPEGFFDELRYRRNRFRQDRRIAHWAFDMEVCRDQFAGARA